MNGAVDLGRDRAIGVHDGGQRTELGLGSLEEFGMIGFEDVWIQRDRRLAGGSGSVLGACQVQREHGECRVAEK